MQRIIVGNIFRSGVAMVVERPYILLSCGMSIDGYLDDASAERLMLSNDADFDRVDEVRAGCDAILVGASTIRQDNPRLLVRSAERRAARVARGEHPNPVKVTVTSTCHLDPQASFFTAGDAEKLVYCATPAVNEARTLLNATAPASRADVVSGEARAAGAAAAAGATATATATVGVDATAGAGGSLITVVDGGDPVDVRRVADDLGERGIRRLMVEGGGRMHTQFLTAGLADELQLVIAPFFVGDARAPRFVHDGAFPWGPANRAGLAEVRQIGDVVLLRYALSDRFDKP
ncbi:5-amino-6-(5-phosphoribosylamino)uracil reductase [Actinoplanes lutulentus]|uniref:5-amino-6-(5-phosphoribosylamino)uracil reductase n=1 Tax=Actinoplanes lutulentus TaxID=1287878 RepID=A0A327Z2T2_9ACTN|nr:5-amino-6-(5-phosphoribosylamino)uracil reductase [Actinoplanes lutulentus]